MQIVNGGKIVLEVTIARKLEVTIARKVLPHPQGIKASISYGAQFSKKLHYFLEIDLYS
jgi:hypothetical protein